jgi:PhzF family phenazine biosynthesis protein
VLLFHIDAFADAAFSGNPAAVCLLDGREPDAQWMQALAAEMNLSETAFVRREGREWSLRWFTPAVEVDLCGHATLATAHALLLEGQLGREETGRFHTRSGVLTAAFDGDLIELDFPSTIAQRCEAPSELVEGLGVQPMRVLRNQFDYLVELASEADVRTLQPDAAMLRRLPVRGIIVTSRASTAGFDFVSRFFAPASGIDEDPVTGSAHCALGPYWMPRLNKPTLVAHQASRRGGTLRVTVAGDRVRLAGRAVTVFRGALKV